LGLSANTEIGAKSRSASNGRFLYSDMLMAIDEVVKSSV
jgi:hypothetical protein